MKKIYLRNKYSRSEQARQKQSRILITTLCIRVCKKFKFSPNSLGGGENSRSCLKFYRKTQYPSNTFKTPDYFKQS